MKSNRERVGLFLKGILMGACDIIPGVSGGSIALITGIYDDLIDAIHSFDKNVVLDLLSGKIKSAVRRIHWDFLITLGLGILLAIISMASLITYVLTDYKIYTYSFFFGLILASAYVLFKKIDVNRWTLLATGVGAVLTYFLVGLVPITTPDQYWFLFLCGMIAICAMILPGISGAFLLLMLGKYHYITGLLKNPLQNGNYIGLIVFGLGCVIGLISFSRVLKSLLSRYHSVTIAFLTGMMLGSLRKIWPYKQVVASKIVDGKQVVLQEALIKPWTIQGSLGISLLLIGLGVVVILVIDRLDRS